MIQGIAYIRVSTEEQALEGVSLLEQEEKIRAYCSLRGIELNGMITDAAVSGAKAVEKRKGGKVLLNRLETRHKIKAVVVVKLDRLFRNAADCLTTIENWEALGIALHVIDLGGNSIDTKSAAGKFMLTMLAGVAEMERNLISERTSAALRYKRKKGEVISGPTFGQDRQGKKVLQNGEEQRAIALMKKLRKMRGSYAYIAKTLQERGVPTKRGGKWRAQTVKNILERNG